MRKRRLVAALALACASLPLHDVARSAPLLGRLEIVLAWSPPNPAVNQTFTISAQVSDNDATVRSVTLCFGDGTPCSTVYNTTSQVDQLYACAFGDTWSRSWTHSYPRKGKFRVTATAVTRGCPGVPDETASTFTDITVL